MNTVITLTEIEARLTDVLCSRKIDSTQRQFSDIRECRDKVRKLLEHLTELAK